MPKFLRRDVVASLLVGVLLAIQLPFVALGNRAMACLSLLAIGGVLVVLAGVQGPDLGGWLTAGLGAVSATTGTIAISHPSTLLSTISIGSVLVLWAVNLTGHLTFRTPEPAS
ncbi:hypothetical protein [Kribbella sp. NPDC048915]|uniref:hypothetical protein n=1 Tax=Kribbella sp. NPDC048915 TaxID=3155148 RepID=UPI0034058C4B